MAKVTEQWGMGSPTQQPCYICSGGTVHTQYCGYNNQFSNVSTLGNQMTGDVIAGDVPSWSSAFPDAVANGWQQCHGVSSAGVVGGWAPYDPAMYYVLGMGGNSSNFSMYWTTPDMPTLQCNSGTTTTTGTTTGATADWWCDPTGQYVNSNGGNCLQSPNQPQSYFTGPYIDEADCNANCTTTPVTGTTGTSATCMNIKTIQCGNPSSGGEWPCATIDGVVPDQSFVGKVIDAGATVAATGAPIYYEITEITSSGSSPWGTQDFPEIPGGCPGSNSPNSSNCIIAWNTPCADTHLNTGGENSWTQFLSLRQSGFDSVGCQHLQNVVNWNTNQLNSGVNSSGVQLNNVQISRKTDQIAWAQCQANECGCPSLNIPPTTGGPTPPPPSAPPSAPPSTGGPKASTTDKKKKDEMPEKEKKKMNEELNRMKKMWKYKI